MNGEISHAEEKGVKGPHALGWTFLQDLQLTYVKDVGDVIHGAFQFFQPPPHALVCDVPSVGITRKLLRSLSLTPGLLISLETPIIMDTSSVTMSVSITVMPKHPEHLPLVAGPLRCKSLWEIAKHFAR